MAAGMAGHTKHAWGAGWPSWLLKAGTKAGETQDAGREGFAHPCGAPCPWGQM